MRQVVYILFFLLCSYLSIGQTGSDSTFIPQYKHGILYTIQTTIGTRHTGFVVEETKDIIVLENRNTHEKIEINKSQIVNTKSKKQTNRYSEEIFGENEHASQYIFSSAAFLFNEGTSVSNNHYIFIQDIDYALTENWAVDVTTFLFYPMSIGTKCSFKLNEVNFIGFSANAMGNIFSSSTGPQFWGYSVLGKYTHGTSNKNLTVSAGLLALNAELFSISTTSKFYNIPFISGAYCTRFAQRFAFDAETWIFPQTMAALVGVGFKYLHNEKISWTFGCYTNVVSDNNQFKLDLKTIPIPYIGYARRFN